MNERATDARTDAATFRHPLDIAPLVFGLIFLGVVVAWGLFELDVIDVGDAAWILPVVLLAAGTLGIALAATKPRRTRTAYAVAPTPSPSDWPSPATQATETFDTTDTTDTTDTFDEPTAPQSSRERHDD
jgi:hypothetical protein